MFKNTKLIALTAFCVCLTCAPVWAGGSVKDNIGQDRKILIDSKTLAGGTIRDGSGNGNKPCKASSSNARGGHETT
ncbi:MAG: hypothetical protein A2X97_02235 [Bdellovibrionales bacterium GWA1_52_35]|nr:MAG: hypothetical protein A2X97_02235 [Bdellovibrionales bacterium GWA1_52_35]HCM39240.1 hypothetical protein [Bdellovibrionales bacterium]